MPPETVWRYWADAELASWWVPPSLTVTECVLEPVTGGRVVLAYRDAEGTYRSEGRVRTAEEPERLAFDLAVLDAAGAVAFSGHYDLVLAAASGGTRLQLGLEITETTVEAVPAIAGIETGWGQVLDHGAPRPQCRRLPRLLADGRWRRECRPARPWVREAVGGQGAGDILVNSSVSVIKALLAEDLIDRLYLIICPEIAGGGPRLFDDGLPGTKWTVAHQEIGEMALGYDRVR